MDEVVLIATDGDGLTVDGRPFAGEAALTADRGPIGGSRIAHGRRRLVVIRREGLWAVRDFDPEPPARRAFGTVEATPYDACWALPGRFVPYDANRTVRVGNADGRGRGLGLAGGLSFALGGTPHTLRAAVEPDGSLRSVFADGTSGLTSYRFRFLRPSPPAADGTVTVDFNRAPLPPRAFAEHFICPFPPPANTLPADVRAGERNVIAGWGPYARERRAAPLPPRPASRHGAAPGAIG